MITKEKYRINIVVEIATTDLTDAEDWAKHTVAGIKNQLSYEEHLITSQVIEVSTGRFMDVN